MRRIEVSSPKINTALAMLNISEALERGQIAQGPQVRQVEDTMAVSFGANHAAALANGTASLRAALIASIADKRLVDRKYIDRYLPGREVIVPAFSFNATLNTVLQIGATARVVDINPEDFCIDRAGVSEVLTSESIAVMPVDLYGQAADISSQDDELKDLAVVRDAAQAHGAMLRGAPIVEHSDATSLSFYPTKNIAAPEGGVVLTNNETIDETVRIYRGQGMAERYLYEMAGDNLRMSDVHAAILKANIGSLAVVTARRQQNAELLNERLRGVEGITTPGVMAGRLHVWHQYTILVEKDFGMTRDELAKRLDRFGIGTGIYYPKTMTDHETFRDHPRIIDQPTPIADAVTTQVLSLPVHPDVTVDDIDQIAETVIKIQNAGT